jgi:hypothetical protein
MHASGVAGRKIDHREARAVGRWRRAENAAAEIRDRFADRDIDQIKVETVPGDDDFQLVAGASMSALAVCRASCPVTMRRIGG